MAKQRDSAHATIAPLQGEVEALPLGPLVPPKITNANRPIHGSLFRFKLTGIALIRGIGGGFPFHLGTEIQEFGKFDDLVFKYQVTTRSTSTVALQICTGQAQVGRKQLYSTLIYFVSYSNCSF
jgi:hypothetical protein